MINPNKDKGKSLEEQQREALQKYREDMHAHFVKMGRSVGLEVSSEIDKAHAELIAWAQSRLGPGKYIPESEYTSPRNIPYLSYIFKLAKDA